MCSVLVLGGPQQTPQKPHLWVPHLSVGCLDLLAAAPLQTPVHIWFCGCRVVVSAMHGLVWSGKSPKFIPSLFFSHLPALVRQWGCSTQLGSPAGTPPPASLGCPPWDTRPLLCKTHSWREKKGKLCKEMLNAVQKALGGSGGRAAKPGVLHFFSCSIIP